MDHPVNDGELPVATLRIGPTQRNDRLALFPKVIQESPQGRGIEIFILLRHVPLYRGNLEVLAGPAVVLNPEYLSFKSTDLGTSKKF